MTTQSSVTALHYKLVQESVDRINDMDPKDHVETTSHCTSLIISNSADLDRLARNMRAMGMDRPAQTLERIAEINIAAADMLSDVHGHMLNDAVETSKRTNAQMVAVACGPSKLGMSIAESLCPGSVTDNLADVAEAAELETEQDDGVGSQPYSDE